jgi:hypothetical protein
MCKAIIVLARMMRVKWLNMVVGRLMLGHLARSWFNLMHGTIFAGKLFA